MTTSKEIAAALQRLEDTNGRVTAREVVDTARAPDNVMHSHFTWDDTKAADQYRLGQARQLIRSVRIPVRVRNLSIPAPAYVRDMSSDDRSGYRNILNVRTEEDSSRATVVDAMQRVVNAVKRAKTLAILFGIEEQIQEIDLLASSIIRTVVIDHSATGSA